MKAILEGLLFVVGDDGLDLNQISDLLSIDLEESQKLIAKLKNEYSNDERGIQIELLGNKYKLTTKKEHKSYYEKLLLEESNKELTQAMLETLAIIAYNEPITRSEIDDIRGVSTSHIIRKLLQRDLIKGSVRSDAPGRPILYETTDIFLDYFGLKSKDELPEINVVPEEKEAIDLFQSKYKENH